MSSANSNQFHNQVMPDEALQERLKAATDSESLSELETEAAIAGECEELEESLLNAISGGVGVYPGQFDPSIWSDLHRRGKGFKGSHG